MGLKIAAATRHQEHQQVEQMSMNWRGRPLVTHEVVIEPVAATSTELRWRASWMPENTQQHSGP